MPLDPKQQPPYYTPGTTPTPTDSIKEYTVQLKQNGTADPYTLEIENTLGPIIWTRSSTGDYTGTLTGAFTANKMYPLNYMAPLSNPSGGFVGFYEMFRTSDNTIRLVTLNTAQTATDISTLFGNDQPFALIKIQIYV